MNTWNFKFQNEITLPPHFFDINQQSHTQKNNNNNKKKYIKPPKKKKKNQLPLFFSSFFKEIHYFFFFLCKKKVREIETQEYISASFFAVLFRERKHKDR